VRLEWPLVQTSIKTKRNIIENLNILKMSYTKFDRHANMNGEILSELMDILKDIRWETSFQLNNMIYGLFDGYLYDEILSTAKLEASSESYKRIKKVVNIVKKYPKIFG
jgi:hypothetical protein